MLFWVSLEPEAMVFHSGRADFKVIAAFVMQSNTNQQNQPFVFCRTLPYTTCKGPWKDLLRTYACMQVCVFSYTCYILSIKILI